MSNQLARLATLTLLPAFMLTGLLGCEDRHESALEPALEQLQSLQGGYVPDPDDDRPFSAYRRDVYLQVSDMLASALPDAPEYERLAVHNLLGHVHGGLAMPVARELARERAQHLAQARVLYAHLSTIEGTSQGIATFASNGSTRIDEIREQIDTLTEQRDDLLAELDAQEQELEALQHERDTYLEQADEAYEQSAQLESESFVAEGDARFELADEAEDVFLQASYYDSRADELQAEIDILQAQIALTNHELAQTERLLGRPDDHEEYWAELDADAGWLSLRDQVRQYEQGVNDAPGLDAEREALREQATDARQEAIAALQQELTDLTDLLEGTLRPMIEEAEGHFMQAADHLSQAQSRAAGDQARRLRQNVVAAHMQTLDLLASYHAHLGIYGGHHLSVESTQARLAEQVDQPFYDAGLYEALASEQQAVAERIDALVDAARSELEVLAEHSDEAIAQRAQQQLAQLDRIQERVAEHALS